MKNMSTIYFFKCNNPIYFILIQVGLEAESESETTYKKVLTKLPTGQRILEDAYSAMEGVMKEFSKYVNVSILSLQ